MTEQYVCNFETQQQLGRTGNVKFCGNYAFKIFHGKQELINIINDKSLEVNLASPNDLRIAKREWNEILILEWLRSLNAEYITPQTSIWLFYGDRPDKLENILLSYYRNNMTSNRTITQVLTDPKTNGYIMPISNVLDGSFTITQTDFIIFIVSEKMTGTVDTVFKEKEYSSTKELRDLLIVIMHRLNNMANATGIVHNDAKFANILYKKLPQITEQVLSFVQPDGSVRTITIQSDVLIYITDFEWGCCAHQLYGYNVEVPEYFSDDSNENPIIPTIGYKYGIYYRGFDVIPTRQRQFNYIYNYSAVYPRLYTIDVLMFVTECLKYGIPDRRDLRVILNFYFANYVRISNNDTEPRYRGVVNYYKMSGYGFASDINSFGERVGI